MTTPSGPPLSPSAADSNQFEVIAKYSGDLTPIAQELQVPVKFVGLGEGIDDLRPFDAREFVNDLI